MIRNLFFFLLLSALPAFARIDAEGLDRLRIDAMIVKELNSQNVLYAKETDKLLKPASLTKVMTALVAIEQGDLDKPVTITPEMIAVEPTKAGYRVGEVIILRDLVKAAMIESDNDAAMAVAIGVGGDMRRFIDMMNLKALRMGMENTQFRNPSGLDHPEHYSTASDLLKLAEYAIQNPVFDEISKLNEHAYASVGAAPRYFIAKTHNRLLGKYAYAVGIKTGYTSKAGPCFIARAKKDGIDCVIVMMNSKENRWKTAEEIFEKVLNPQADVPPMPDEGVGEMALNTVQDPA